MRHLPQHGVDADGTGQARSGALVVDDSCGYDVLHGFGALLQTRHTGPHAAWAKRQVATLTVAKQHELRRFPYVTAFQALIPLLPEPKGASQLIDAIAALPISDYLRIALTTTGVTRDTPLESPQLLALVENPAGARAFVDGYLGMTGRWRSAFLDMLAHPEEARRTLLALLHDYAAGPFEEIEPELAPVRAQAVDRLRSVVMSPPERWPAWFGPYRDLTGFSPVVLAVSVFLGTGLEFYFHEMSRSLLDDVPNYEPFVFVAGAQRVLSPTEIGPRGLSTVQGIAPPDPDARLAAVFSALGDATRLRLLRLLAERPYFGQEVAAALGIASPTAWRHLGILEKAGLVSIQRRARRTYYVLHPEALAQATEAMDRMLVRGTTGHESPAAGPVRAEDGL